MKGWVITRYEDVKHVAVTHSDMSADRLSPFFAAAPADRQSSYVHLMTYLGKWMVFRDPPEHTRLRRLFTKAFTSRSVKALEPNVEQIVGLLFDEMEQKSRSTGVVDWIADFAYALPATVMMDLLGVPREDLRLVKEWSDDIALFIGTARATADKYLRAEAGAKAMADYFRGIIAKRAADPRDDIISQLVAAREERDALTDDEVIATCILLLFAGHETTTNLLGNGLYYTMKFPDQWKRIKDDPSLVESAVEEWLRYDGPSGALVRVMTADVEFGNKQLLQGQRLFAFVNAANRDSGQFANSDRFDIGRSPNAHLTFGHGIHFASARHSPDLRDRSRCAPDRTVSGHRAGEHSCSGVEGLARSPGLAVAPGAFALIRRKCGNRTDERNSGSLCDRNCLYRIWQSSKPGSRR